MSSTHNIYQDIVDDDPFPWYRFPDYSEEEKKLSHLTITGEEPKPLCEMGRQSDQNDFRGEYGTNFQPPGLERTMTCNLLHAKHPPPGLSFPTMLPPCFSTPMKFSQSTASAVKSVPQSVPQSNERIIDGKIADMRFLKLGLRANSRHESSAMSSPPLMAFVQEGMMPTETGRDTVELSMEQGESATCSLIEDPEVLELEEIRPVTSGPLIVSSEDWILPRRTSQIQESSNENSVLSNASNTPERLVSNKTSNTSLKSEPHDLQS